MDIDSFFTVGPEIPFQTNDVFTDREIYLHAFDERALAHNARSFDVAALTDSAHPARNVMALVGDGGFGKSTVVRQLARRSVAAEVPGLPGRCAAAVVDFAEVASLSFETVMLRVRAALGPLGRSWPAFDIALALYWERKHPGESLTTFLRKSSSLGEPTDAVHVSEQITEVIDGLLGGIGGVGIGYRLANLAGHKAAETVTLRRLRGQLPAFDALIAEPDPDKMAGYLPLLLAYDLEQHRADHPSLALCVLDTFEHVQALPPERWGLEDLMCRLVYLLPNVFFLVASRRRLAWHDPVRSVGLTYGGAQRWPGLADLPGGDADHFGLRGFDDTSAEDYLSRRLTQEGQPLIPPRIRSRIIAGAGGSPHYLDLSAGLFSQIAARGQSPAPEMFGRPFPELVLRIMRDLDPINRDLLRAAALLEAFDGDLLAAVVPGARAVRIEQFLVRSFVRTDATVWPPHRLHENLRAAVSSCDHYTPDGWSQSERRRNALIATGHLEDLVLSVWNAEQGPNLSAAALSRRIVAAFLLAFYAAREHQVLPLRLGEGAYTLYELGHWQVLASLPPCDDGGTPELARLSAAARFGAGEDMDFPSRYRRLKAAVGDPTSGAYADDLCFTLGNLAFSVGDLAAAQEYFTAITTRSSILGAGAILGLAGIAQRQSRFADHVAYARQISGSTLDQIRLIDTLGHHEMHNARFAQAAALFTKTLEHARAAGAPLWVARATRHLALATMWFDPDRALATVPEAHDLNAALGDGIGIGQCEMATALAHALHGRWTEAERFLAEAHSRFAAMRVEFELLPVQVIEILLRAGSGNMTQARTLAGEMITATRDGHPVGPPSWSAVAALWVGEPDWFAFDTFDWTDPSTASKRWMAPLARLRAVAPSLQ